MMPVKKQFEPSLPAISQVIELQNLMILRRTVRQGCIKKEKGLFPSWKHKSLCFQFVPDEKLVCEVCGDDGIKVQETLNLASARLSHKCSEVDDRICFGVVTPNDQKYLVALKSNRECLKIFKEIVSARMIMGMSMFRSYNPYWERKPQTSQDSKRDLVVPEAQPLQGGKDRNSRDIAGNGNSLSGDNNRGRTEINAKKEQPQSTKQIENKGQSFFKFNSRESEFSKTNTLFENLYKDEGGLIQQCLSLQRLKGFKLLKEFESGGLYQNSAKVTKGKLLIYSPESARETFTLLYQFDLWNHKVKKFKKLSRLSQGVYKFYLQFHKTGCFSVSKSCEVLLSLSNWDSDFYLTMNTACERPEYIQERNWVSFSSCAKIGTKLNNPREKEVYFCFSSAQSNDLAREFGEELSSFPKFVIARSNLPLKELEIRNVNDK